MEVERFAVLVGERMHRPRRNERGSRSERLTAALRDLVESGDLLPGTRLPSERALGAVMGLSRGTVGAAYEALGTTGLLERRHGSGSYVRLPHPPPATGAAAGTPADTGGGPAVDPATGPAAGGARTPVFSRWLREGAIVVDLAKSVIPDTTGLPPLTLRVEDLIDVRPQDGYGRLGDARLRDLIRRDLLPPHPAGSPGPGVLVTTGGQQAIHLVCDALLQAGDRVLVERTTYPGLLAALQRFGALAIPVDGDRHGFHPDALEAAAALHRPVFAFTMPVHNPTGAIAAASRVQALARTARDTGMLLVEDHTLSPLVLDPPATVPSAVTDAPGSTLVLGSLSKVVWGGIRIGWIAAPPHLLDRLAEAKRRTDLAGSALDQRLAAHLLDDPGHLALATTWRTRLRERRDHLAAALADRLPQWHPTRPRGGLSTWVRLPGVDGEEFNAIALRHGVAVSPGAVFSPVPGPAAQWIRLSHAWPEPVLSQAVDLLAAAWRETTGRPSAS